jgi:beta-N-acetylhexosaminidase
VTERLPPRAVIIGLAGDVLLADEARLIKKIDPAGIILFRRNIRHPDQIRRLTDDLRTVLGHEHPAILVDQEGGRVRRLAAPPWPAFPAAGHLARHPSGLANAAHSQGRLMAQALRDCGITVNCAPMLDIRATGSNDAVLGDRCFGDQADPVIIAGAANMQGIHQAGLVAVMKHLPGHGRAMVDSHYDMPVIETDLHDLHHHDFKPFQHLAALRDDRLWGMTAHILLPTIDPDFPATQSRLVIDRVIRGMIGFEGILLSDDIEMGALRGTMAARVEQSLAAGCDVVLHCSGKLKVFAKDLQMAPRLAPSRWDLMRQGLMAASQQALPLWDAVEYQQKLDDLMVVASDRLQAQDPTLFKISSSS